jgi:hypothetical protein
MPVSDPNSPRASAGVITYQEFMANRKNQSDREIIEYIAWEAYQARLQVQANGAEIVRLRERVDEIESQANEAMANLTTPEAMMGMADKFLGGTGK